MQVGKQIQHYRKEKNLSQDDLAEIIFVSRQSISNWERGATYPDIQNLLLLSKVFEVSLDKLVKGDLETMKQIIHDQEFMRYQKDGVVFTILLIGSPIIMIPLIILFPKTAARITTSSDCTRATGFIIIATSTMPK